MTTSTSSSHPLRLDDIGELLAAVPAMLGFRPCRSILVLSLTPTALPPRGPGRVDSIGVVMRHDLLLPGDDGQVPPPMREAFDRFGAVCSREGADSVLVLLVDDRLEYPFAPAVNSARQLVEDLTDRLGLFGIGIAGVHAIPEINCGEEWFTPGGEVGGVLPDPGASLVAAARVFGGNPIHRSRSELENLLAPYPPETRGQVADRIDDALESRDVAYERAVRAGGREHADRLELEAVLARMDDHRGEDEPTVSEYAELAVLLANPTVRDALLALAVGVRASVAERLWIRMTRALPDPERADAAALVGFSAYVRGDGPLAGVALGVALEANPRHRLSDLLDQALQAGLRPDAIRGLAETGHEIAARLGVALPPREPVA
ncbi:DUF4192 domain-containing protein [Rhodococcus chondri]|uniref:DUF4192 domain-containing protein n=1 Tax=Rhodococcus chondri TaxID=3065941 RepID=A0ABU7JRX5_9NOCA|nr:DUF4192 domain-containing protein [Rhodococcus sp. CC-R104]MEE2032781.1 DUF4192 domain-containing protein [Rhodococcus sp. CC-R104]